MNAEVGIFKSLKCFRAICLDSYRAEVRRNAGNFPKIFAKRLEAEKKWEEIQEKKTLRRQKIAARFFV